MEKKEEEYQPEPRSSTLEYGDDAYWNRNGYGRKYRGAGYIQMTWPDAYKEFAREVNDDDVMNNGAEYVAKKYPWQASGFWWSKLNKMNDLVDALDGTDSDVGVEKITRRVKGSPTGVTRRAQKHGSHHYKKDKLITNGAAKSSRIKKPVNPSSAFPVL